MAIFGFGGCIQNLKFFMAGFLGMYPDKLIVCAGVRGLNPRRQGAGPQDLTGWQPVPFPDGIRPRGQDVPRPQVGVKGKGGVHGGGGAAGIRPGFGGGAGRIARRGWPPVSLGFGASCHVTLQQVEGRVKQKWHVNYGPGSSGWSAALIPS